MSHPEQQAFFRTVVEANRTLVAGSQVLEIGAYDVNGSVRSIFADAGGYVGIDLREGPGVDRVCFGHEVDDPDGAFDVALSGECLEHDPHWRETFTNMVRLTRPGGLVVFTCASRGRPEHGTRRTAAQESPGTQFRGLDYYRNLEASDFATMPLDDWFTEHRFWYLPTSFDLYFVGIRTGATDQAALPQDHQVWQLRQIMPRGHRLVRAPLRVLRSAVSDESTYQSLARPYWRSVLALGSAAATAVPRLKREAGTR